VSKAAHKAGLPVMPVYNCFTVNNLGFYGMEEVIGSIPIRSTK
jgi:hypothetical protein